MRCASIPGRVARPYARLGERDHLANYSRTTVKSRLVHSTPPPWDARCREKRNSISSPNFLPYGKQNRATKTADQVDSSKSLLSDGAGPTDFSDFCDLLSLGGSGQSEDGPKERLRDAGAAGFALMRRGSAQRYAVVAKVSSNNNSVAERNSLEKESRYFGVNTRKYSAFKNDQSRWFPSYWIELFSSMDPHNTLPVLSGEPFGIAVLYSFESHKFSLFSLPHSLRIWYFQGFGKAISSSQDCLLKKRRAKPFHTQDRIGIFFAEM